MCSCVPTYKFRLKWALKSRDCSWTLAMNNMCFFNQITAHTVALSVSAHKMVNDVSVNKLRPLQAQLIVTTLLCFCFSDCGEERRWERRLLKGQHWTKAGLLPCWSAAGDHCDIKNTICSKKAQTVTKSHLIFHWFSIFVIFKKNLNLLYGVCHSTKVKFLLWCICAFDTKCEEGEIMDLIVWKTVLFVSW